MNPLVIRENLSKHIGQKVHIKIYGMRNRTSTITGILKDIYPQIFTVQTEDSLKTFSYSELISGEVVLTFI